MDKKSLHERAYEREKAARKKAEAILNKKSLELYQLNQQLGKANQELDQKVQARTAELEAINGRFHLAVSASSAGIWECNLETGDYYFSSRLFEILGYKKTELIQFFDSLEVVHKKERRPLRKAIYQHLHHDNSLNFECRILLKKGGYKWFSLVGLASRDEQGKANLVAGSLTDIHERIESSLLIKRLAHEDALTQLPNRAAFEIDLKAAFKEAALVQEKFAILIIDVNDFKAINDAYGHVTGDFLLKNISLRFKCLLSQKDTISRIGGDEFCVIVHHVNDIQQLENRCKQLIASGSQPLFFEGAKIKPKFSIGIAIFPQHGKGRTELLTSADYAMYEAKKMKVQGSAWQFFEDEFRLKLSERRRIGKDLHTAIEQKQFYLCYQPLITAVTHSCENVEALLRWEHPVYGNISPAEFIPVAEESGVILQLGEWVFEEACKQIRLWMEHDLKITVAINISPIQFANQNLPKMFQTYIDKYAVPAEQIEIEVTENVLMNNLQQAAAILNDVHAMGIKVSLDDFGTGYSSLSYLQQLPIDKLKIDRVFVNDVVDNKERQAITKAVIQMAHALGLKVVSEGIENAEQLSFFENQACDIMQGFYFSKPIKGDLIPDYLLHLSKTSQLL